jgi:RNA polymerase sigma-70 factor (ECF subfamily)
MLGSTFEAEDAVQETMIRAWRKIDGFEGRSALKSWLYQIATNVCLTMLDGRKRRARPMDFGPMGTTAAELVTQPEVTWLEPMPDALVMQADSDPVEQAMARETLRLAFVAALQHLPAKQRAVLILREVLRWKADEVAELLETSVASVNSALQRARATLAANNITEGDPAPEMDASDHELVAKYLAAFESYDIDSLVTLLAEDATLSMPPYDLWLQGPEVIHEWMTGRGAACEGSRLIPVMANGSPAFGQYRPSGPNGEHEPWALIVLELAGGKIVGQNSFLDTARMFPLFGLPQSLPV